MHNELKTVETHLESVYPYSYDECRNTMSHNAFFNQ